MALPSYDELVGELPSYDELVSSDEKPSDTFAQEPPKTLADIMSGRYGRDVHIPPNIHVPTLNEVGVVPAPLLESAFRYGNPMGWAQIAAEKIAPEAPSTKIAKGLISGASESLAGFTTPENLSALAIMPESKIAQTLLGLGFEAKAISDVPEQIRAYGETDDVEQKAKIATGIAASLGLPAIAIAHGVLPKAAEVPPVRRWPASDRPIETEPVKTTQEVAKAEPLPERPPQVPPVSERDILIPVDERGQPHPSIASDVQRQKPVEVPVPQPEISAPEVESANIISAIRSGGTNIPRYVELANGVQHEIAPFQPITPDGDVALANGDTASLSVIRRVLDEKRNPIIETRKPNAIPENHPPQVTTGVANRVLKAEAETGRIEPIEPGEGMSWQEMVDLGREKLNSGADPQMIARRFQRNGRISAEDFAVVRAERERLAGETMAAENTVRQNPNDVNARNIYNTARQTETDWVRNVVQPAKTATSDIFRGMQGEATIDPTTFAGLRRAVLDIHGRDVAPNEVVTLSTISERTRKAVAESSESLQRSATAVENTFGKKAKPRSVEELREHLANRIRDLTPCQ